MRYVLAVWLMLVAGVAHATDRPVTFASHGAKLHGILVMPDSGRASAGVVLIHGSGPDGAEDYLSQAKAFARGGVAALVYDKRGWNLSGGDWRHRSFDLLASDAVAGARALRIQPGVPPDRVGYWGISQGGWVVAQAAAKDPAAAFVIGIAATGVSPTSQELWHKDQLMIALGYSLKARSIALDFWRLAFDFIVKVDSGVIPIPADMLVNERAGASTGLNYDPRLAWSRVRAPVLLLYGDQDLLEPAKVSAPMIRAALTGAGHAPPTVHFFKASSHAITTRQTGLTFDWGESFHPRYYPTMLTWMADPTLPQLVGNDRASLAKAATIFDPGERYGRALPLRGALIQLPLLIVLPLAMTVWVMMAVTGIIRRGGSPQLTLDLGASLGGVLVYAGFVTFIARSVFAQGLAPTTGYTIPVAQSILPLMGSATLALALASITFRARSPISRSGWVNIVMATLTTCWIVSWGIFGRPL